VWGALSTEPRAAFCYVVTLPIDLELVFTSPLVLGSTLAFRSLSSTEGGAESRTWIHGVVRDSNGAPLSEVTVMTIESPVRVAVTRADGGFTLRTPAEGRVPLRLTHADGRTTLTELDLDVEHTEYEVILN
jgi:hypothetical protein